MNREPLTDLFEIKLSQEGANHLLRLHKTNRLYFAGYIICSALLLFNAIVRYVVYAHRGKITDWKVFVLTDIYPIWMIVAVIVVLIQVYCYITFSKVCKRSIEQQLPDEFNASFKWLRRNTTVGIVVIILQILDAGFFTLYNYLTMSF